MAAIDNLNATYANIAAQLAAVTANPKPTYTVDGETWQWAEYVDMLNRQLLSLEQSIQRAGGPYMIRSRGGL